MKKLLPSISVPQSPAPSKQPSVVQTITQSIDHLTAPQEKSPELQVTGIMTIQNKPAALINGEIYEEGEAIQGMHVYKITSNQVQLIDANGEVATLELRKKP